MIRFLVCPAVVSLCSVLAAQPATTPLFWPEKNGPMMNCLAPDSEAARIPLEWDVPAGKNVVWSVDIEDEGHSTPVVGGDLIWFTSATTDGRKQYVYCVDRNTGKILHHRLMWENENPEELGNPINNYAAPSPVLEADAVYVHFGTYGTARLDPRTCEPVWERRDINVRHFRGPGSSPVVYDHLLILTFDGIDQQFTIALDKKTGKTVWQTPRTNDYGDIDPATGKPKRDGDYRKAFGTPSFATVDGRMQMISVGSCAAFGYDPLTGEELWVITHKNMNAAPRTLITPKMAIINTGSERSTLIGVRLDGKMRGDITQSHIVWERTKRNSSESSPVLVNGLIFQITRGGILSCVDPETGEDVWEDRLDGQHLPSPVAAGDYIFYFNDRGDSHVIRASKKFEIVAKNNNGEAMTASPAIADGAIYLRTKTKLIRVEKK